MQIRPATLEDVPGIARVHVASWRTTYVGIMPDELLATLSEERRAAQWSQALTEHADRTYLYVAVDDSGAVVGFACGGPEDREVDGYDSKLYAIYLLKDVQRQGIGRSLTQAVARQLHEAGFARMMLWVARDNLPSVGFYEAIGGTYITEKVETIGTTELAEVAYGYEIRSLVETLEAH
jgi:ribosomal protein S18 acetylase RimI-like enzyme